MNSDEYIKLLKSAFEISKKIDCIDEVIPFINQIRLIHKKLQTELEYYLIDPISYEKPEEREKILAIAREIKEICISSGSIKYVFNKLPNEHIEFRSLYKFNKSFARYSYKDVDITNIIVFITGDKKYKYIKDEVSIDMVDDKDISLADLDFVEEKDKKEGMTYGVSDMPENKLEGLD